ncbi:hypothetical protein [Streptomyces abikoensis]|uniref:Excreted virulence factor EspC, type VII ESX diderm n=1 Tax=Streptomyces abikoensis TaxID=97398 RepID=A0ABW7T6B1_9ACTN
MTDAQFQQPAAESRILLASAAPSGGGGGGTHKASVTPWTTAGGVADELHQDMGTALGDLGHAHDGIKAGTTGFASAAALSTILGTWETRLGAVRSECQRLSGDLKKAGVSFGENEAAVKASFEAVRSSSKIDDYSKGR